MATNTWNGSSADWYTPADWSLGRDPGPTDDVVINSGEVQLLNSDPAIKVASISVTGGVLALQETGKTKSVTGNVSITGSGNVDLDGAYANGAGGSSLTIGGTLTNSSSSGYGARHRQPQHHVGRHCDGEWGGRALQHRHINIIGSTTARATLNIANAAAGFGTKGVETGTVVLENDALLEFKGGEITTVNGELQLDGANAHVADASATSSNSALTGLSSVTDFFLLQNGAKVAPTGNLSLTGTGTM